MTIHEFLAAAPKATPPSNFLQVTAKVSCQFRVRNTHNETMLGHTEPMGNFPVKSCLARELEPQQMTENHHFKGSQVFVRMFP